MTTEDALQVEIDRDPDNYFLREVLADYLAEIGDSRSDGYRVLGRSQTRAEESDCHYGFFWIHNSEWPHARNFRCTLPMDWWDAYYRECKPLGGYSFLRSRSLAENIAAVAFSKLPPERQQQLLKGVYSGVG